MENIPPPIISSKVVEQKPLESKIFNMKSDKNNIFEIIISKTNKYIILQARKLKTDISNIYYSKNDIEIIKKNKFFLMFDNLNEIYDEIINLMNNNNPNLKEDSNKLLISIPLSITKIKEIILEINEKEKSDKEKIKELYEMINNLKLLYNNEIKELNNKIQNQNNIIQEQNDKINNINNIIQEQNDKINNINNIIQEKNNKINEQNIKIKELNNKIEKQNKQIDKLDNITMPKEFNDSIIINKNYTYILNLKKWISPKNIYFTTKLLYRKSKNGDSFDKFHRLCDNKGKTLVLIEGEEGFIIGGYTTKNWDKSNEWYKDDDSFLFSLTQGKIFPIIKGKDTIKGRDDLGPWFAYIGFGKGYGKGNYSQGYFSYHDKNSMCFENYNEIIPNEKKSRLFDVKDVEIYQINFL